VHNSVTRKNRKFGFVTRGHVESWRAVGLVPFVLGGGRAQNAGRTIFSVENALKIAGKFAADSRIDSQAMRFPIPRIYFRPTCAFHLTYLDISRIVTS